LERRPVAFVSYNNLFVTIPWRCVELKPGAKRKDCADRGELSLGWKFDRFA
jgi:hypothetical protein